jgi:hypothetical protein
MSETEKKDLEALLEDVFKSTSADKNYSASLFLGEQRFNLTQQRFEFLALLGVIPHMTFCFLASW